MTAVITLKRESSSQSGAKRVVLKSHKWETNFESVVKAIASKWQDIEFPESCYLVVENDTIDSISSLQSAVSNASNVKKIVAIVKVSCTFVMSQLIPSQRLFVCHCMFT